MTIKAARKNNQVVGLADMAQCRGALAPEGVRNANGHTRKLQRTLVLTVIDGLQSSPCYAGFS
jgi:hypothetical protein